jgi:uncharacterized protein
MEERPVKLSVAYDVLPKRHTSRTALVMDHFGIGFETGRRTIAENLELELQPGELVCFTGESGSGKSSLLRETARQLEHVVDLNQLPLEPVSLVDGLRGSFDEGMRWLSLCGLGEATLMLRRPGELSDGERFRYRLALALSHRPRWILVDEFTATLDRTLAKVIAFNARRVCSREGIGFLLATTHDDILGDLQPDWQVRCRLDGSITPTRSGGKKKESASRTSSKLPTGPRRTGRTSLGGITAADRRGSCGS